MAPSSMSVMQDEEARKKNPFGRTGPVRPAAKPFMIDEARCVSV